MIFFLLIQVLCANPLSLWSPDHQQQLRSTIQKAKKQEKPFVVFDADNTIWKHDVTLGMMAWLEGRGVLSLQQYPQHLLVIPPKEKESVYGYYERLCVQMGDSTCYLWSAQAFQGVPLSVMRTEVKAMMATEKDMPVTIYKNGIQSIENVPVPKIFPTQIQLIHELQKNGIEVWVVSASLEELVRMIVSDSEFGINIPSAQVIGVNMLIQREDGTMWASAQHRIAGMKGADYFDEERMTGVLTHHLYAPATWYSGKVAAIQEWIHPNHRPMLVAGDSPNDFFMQFYSNASQGGTRLRIHRKDSHKRKLEVEKKKRERAKNSTFDPHLGWLEVSW